MATTRRLILFAHPLEAKPTIETLNATLIGRDLYRYELGLIAISGMGCLNAACTVARLAPAVDEVINLGLCGSLQSTIEPESFHWVDCVSKHVFNRTARLNVHPTLGDGTKRLLSCDAPIYDSELRGELSCDFDLVDMEGYGVATAAERIGLPWRLGKIVSDTASEEGWKELETRLPTLAKSLSQIIDNQGDK